ncbi:MAG TPA: SCO family protein [Candidatus Saccharimonadales bacterium]|nr:SCO family protein [Candidatus Saccharimonadales bacterium]
MKRAVAFILLAFVLLQPSFGAVTDSELKDIEFKQNLGQQISLDLPFVDENGRQIRLGDCLGQKPAMLVLGYYGCPMLCTLVLNGLISTLQDLKPSVGDKFSVIFVSINPSETPDLAAAKKKNYLKLYGRKSLAPGWHFLTGSKESIALLAEEVGYRYLYDPASKQFAHPSGVVILTPDGKVSRYFFGINFVARDLDKSLQEASSHQIGSEVRQFVYLCFHYNPIHGKYGAIIMNVVRIGGAGTLVGLVCLIFIPWRPLAAKERPVA